MSSGNSGNQGNSGNSGNMGNTGRSGAVGNTSASPSGYGGYAGQPLSPSRASGGARQVASASGTTNLADLLERVLDKGIVIAGDITVSLGQVELLSIKVRLLVASIDKAQEIGIDWWRSDPALSSHARQMEMQNAALTSRLDHIEEHLKAISAPQPHYQNPGQNPGPSNGPGEGRMLQAGPASGTRSGPDGGGGPRR